MKLMILDGNSIVNRAYYGIRMLNAPDGTPTNGIYGFLTILHKLLEEEKPDGVCVAFDLKGPTFRHKQYDGYKAQRKGMPDDLAVQIPILKEVMDSLGIKRLELEGYEADDLIGTVSKICERENSECIVVTGDKDSFQLITNTTRVKHVKSRMGKTETINYTPDVFKEEYGFDPIKIIDLKALMGDASDNIPGVKGVGAKTASSLILKYGTVQEIYKNLDELDIKDSVRRKLSDGREAAKMSYELATIVTNVPIEFSPCNCQLPNRKSTEAHDIFTKLGFFSLIEKWGIYGETSDLDILEENNIPTVEFTDILKLDELLRKFERSEYISVLPVDGGLDALEICDGESVYFLRWNSLSERWNEILTKVFSSKIKKVSHNVKDIMHLLTDKNLPFGGFIFDTALAAYLIDPMAKSYKIEKLCPQYLKHIKSGTDAIFELYPILKQRLINEGEFELFNKIELPLCEVLADMEHTGVLVDKKALSDFGTMLSKNLDELQSEIFELSGEEFNINSPKQLGVILFEKLMLPSGKKTKTGWSTSADVLDKLRGKHPIVDKVLEYRQISKLKSTYADGLLKVIANDGRIHTSFQMTVTATGRLSSTEPNLQNIPVRTSLGAEFRKMFVSPKGKLLADADYSQIELRLLAHISGDDTMKNAFVTGEDIHSVTASQVFGIPINEVTSLQRSHAKAVNFGIVYGISAFSLSQDIGVFTSEAKAYIDAYLEKYHGVREYMKTVVAKAYDDGFVSTLYGRKRQMHELTSSNKNIRKFGERVALNMPIQGTAADIIKLAMVNVYKRLKKERLQAKLILQIHDELIVECPEEECESVQKILTEEMESAVNLSVPMKADTHVGKSWSEAK